MNEIRELEKTIKEIFQLTGKQPLSKIIAYLRELNLSRHGIFLYDSVKASYRKASEKDMYSFVSSKGTYETNLNPRIIICLFEKKPINLQSVKVANTQQKEKK